jgi:hypothetical protein
MAGNSLRGVAPRLFGLPAAPVKQLAAAPAPGA